MPITGTYALSIVGPDGLWVAGMRPPPATDHNGIMRVDMAHYQHGQWTTFHLPVGAQAPFHMNSPSDGWLMGSPLPQQVMHYDGTSWQPSPFSDHAPSTYGAIDVLDGDDAWAFTATDSGSPSTLTSLQHYAGGQWKSVPWPFLDTVLFPPFIRVAAGDYWTFGEYIDASNTSVWHGVLLHYVGGVWYRYGV
jgi:hypothetical protein